MIVLQMKKDTKAIKTWAKVQLSSIVVHKSKWQQIKTSFGEHLTTIGKLNFVFVTDASPAVDEKVWQCLFGVFDSRRS